MDNNQNKDNKNNKNRNSLNILLTLVGWALLLTVALQYLNLYLGSPRSSTTTHEIDYSDVDDLVRGGHVERVELENGLLTIYPVEGYAYTDDEGNTYTDNYTLFTVNIGDPGLYDLLNEYNVDYNAPYVPETPVIFLLNITREA